MRLTPKSEEGPVPKNGGDWKLKYVLYPSNELLRIGPDKHGLRLHALKRARPTISCRPMLS
jgi:hypothetical protein